MVIEHFSWRRVDAFGKMYLSRLRMFTRNIRLFLIGLFLAGLGMTFWRLLFNLYLQQAGYSKEFIGDVLALGNVAVAIAALPAGLVMTRIGPRKQIIVTQFLSALAFGAAAMSAMTPALLLTFVFLAFAFSTFVQVVGGPFIMRNSTPVERTYIFSILFIIMLAGGVLGNAGAGWLKDGMEAAGVASLDAYRWTILIGVGCSLVGLVPFLFLRATAEDVGGKDGLKLSGFRSWNWRLFGKALLPETLLATGAGLIVQFMNLYFKDVFNSTDRAIGIYLSAQSATMVLGILFAPVLAEKFTKINTIAITQLVSLPFMLILAFTHNLHLAVAAFVVRAALMNMSGPIAETLVLELCRKEEQGILRALEITSWSISWGFSAWLYGRVLKADYAACFIIASALYLISSVLYWTFFRNAEKKFGQAEEPAEQESAIS